MKAYFTRAYAFSASHRLQTEALSEDENRAAFGKCNNPHGHGHNYRIEVTVAGPIDRATGMVIDMVQLDSIVNQQVTHRFDHIFEPFEIDHEAGNRIDSAGHRDLDGVVMPMSIAVGAAAESGQIALFRPLRIPVIV